MKLVVFSDIHSDGSLLKKVIKKASNDIVSADLLICNGDFTDMFKIPRDMWMKEVESMLSPLLKTNKKLLCVPGNHDPPQAVDLFEKNNVNIHGKKETIQGFDFIGFGGAVTPFNTSFEPSEETTRQTVGSLAKEATNPLVFILHNPPKGTKLDMAGRGMHVGSAALRSLILEHNPILALTAHIHECSGIDTLGETTLFYPGLVSHGHYGVVLLNENQKPKCIIKHVA